MEVIEPQPSHAHTHTVINLHGRDSTAAEYAAEFNESEGIDGPSLTTTFPGFKWVYLQAPMLESQRFGCEMTQWFDMWSTEDPYKEACEQVAELNRSMERVQKVVDDEAELVGREHIILCGISQGAATAIAALLASRSRICAFIGLSTWLPPPVSSEAGVLSVVRSTPVLLGHCRDDEVIKLQYGEGMKEALETAGFVVDWHLYDEGGHWINEPCGIDDIVRFLKKATA